MTQFALPSLVDGVSGSLLVVLSAIGCDVWQCLCCGQVGESTSLLARVMSAYICLYTLIFYFGLAQLV